jgi:ABC-2 type transport system ATP-binding protein
LITIRSLTKTYRRNLTALDRIDLDIGTGMVGLLGANGAGKTTLLRILAGILPASAGTILVDAHDLRTPAGKRAVKRDLGYLPQDLGVYPDLTARGFLDYIAILKGIDGKRERRAAIESVLALTGLDQVADRRLKTFSGGMKRRVGIAQALLNRPGLLIVDEPTAGLDPEERVRFRTLLSSLAADRTVLLSTHIVEDVASTSQDLAVLARGRVLYSGSVTGLAAVAADRVWTLTQSGAPPADTLVVSAIHRKDVTEYRLIADRQPAAAAVPAGAGLEDGYMALMHDQRLPAARAREPHPWLAS